MLGDKARVEKMRVKLLTKDKRIEKLKKKKKKTSEKETTLGLLHKVETSLALKEKDQLWMELQRDQALREKERKRDQDDLEKEHQ